MQLINFSNLTFENTSSITPKVINFPDGEFKVVLDDVPEDSVYCIVVQTDKQPAEKILITAMLVDIVSQMNPEKIIVVHPWLSFSRQDKRFISSEPLSIFLITKFYASLGVTDLVSCDIHTIEYRNPGIHKFEFNSKILNIHNINIIGNFYTDEFKSHLVVSPTGEDEPFLSPLEDNTDITYFSKRKICMNCQQDLQLCTCGSASKPEYIIDSKKNLSGEQILLLDDIIAGGGTMNSTVELLKKSNVQSVIIGVTHGFFNNESVAKNLLEFSDGIIASNTVMLPDYVKNQVRTYDIAPVIFKYIRNLS